MAWKIIIGDGANPITIETSANFQISEQKSFDGDGSVSFVDQVYTIAGDVEEASGPTDRILELKALVDNHNPTRVRFVEDGVDKIDLLPSQFLNGPQVQRFLTLPDDGSGEFHWPYQLEILARSGDPDAGLGNGAISGTRNTVTEMFGVAVVRKIWTISVVATTRAQALAICRSKKPSAFPLREIVTEDGNPNGATIQWIWEAAKGSVILFAERDPVFREGSRRFVEQKQVLDSPIAHRARDEFHRMSFGGIIQAVAKAGGLPPDIQIPPAHLQEDGVTIIRVAQEGSSPPGQPVLIDPKQGIYQTTWEENYWIAPRANVGAGGRAGRGGGAGAGAGAGGGAGVAGLPTVTTQAGGSSTTISSTGVTSQRGATALPASRTTVASNMGGFAGFRGAGQAGAGGGGAAGAAGVGQAALLGIPVPDHSGHDKPFSLQAPPDGDFFN